MKHLIFLLSLLIGCMAVSAQTKTKSYTNSPVNSIYVPTYLKVTMNTAADTILATGTYTIDVSLNTPSKVAYAYAIHLNKISGTGAGKIYHYIRNFNDQTWTLTADSVTYGNFTGDTVYFKTQATAVQADQMRWVVNPTDGTAQKIKVNKLELKLAR